ncbi:hypothetical protein ACHAXR_005667 [Thalassiosira sp. AJA248-18]
MLALVRSANDSMTDIAIFNKRAHGFLPKAPIRREKINEVIAPMWLKRFPSSDFGDSAIFDNADETVSIASEEIACSSFDIAQKMIDIESLFEKKVHFTDMRIIHDQLHELKGDLLSMGWSKGDGLAGKAVVKLNSDACMISILGTINLILLGHGQSPEVIIDKWHALRDRIDGVINSLQSSPHGSEGQHARLSIFRRASIQKLAPPMKNSFPERKSLLSNSVVSNASSKLSDDSNYSNSIKKETHVT